MDTCRHEKEYPLTMNTKDIFNMTGEEEAVSMHMGLVKSIAARFMGRGVEFDDLVQLGSIGLIKAIRNFNPKTENAFSTYAVPLIMGEIRRYFRDNGPVKISRKIQSDFRIIRNYINDYEAKNQTEPHINEIVQGTGLHYDEVILAMNATTQILSLSPDENGNVPNIRDESTCISFDKIEFFDVISNFAPDEKKLLYLRFFKGLTQTQTAEILQMNQVKISRMEKKIKEKLKNQLDYK